LVGGWWWVNWLVELVNLNWVNWVVSWVGELGGGWWWVVNW
jgi:hypothetical protein